MRFEDAGVRSLMKIHPDMCCQLDTLVSVVNKRYNDILICLFDLA